MGASLHIEPGITYEWDKFIQIHSQAEAERNNRSSNFGHIALDGLVAGAPRSTTVTLESGLVIPFANINHHEDVDRLATLSTAQQILKKVKMGMDDMFTQDEQFSPNVYVNDCDQDVCLAWWLLDNIAQTRNQSPALHRLVEVAGNLDVTAGMYPYDKDEPILRKLNWVFRPYFEARSSGVLSSKNPDVYESIIQNVGLRIHKHLMGDGGEKDLDVNYNVIGGGNNWSMIEKTGDQGRVGAISDGIRAFVTVTKVDDDRWRYSIGKISEYITFDIESIYDELNRSENCDGVDKWGGSDTIGGSPRMATSKLQPIEVEGIINAFIQKNQRLVTAS